MKGPECGDEVVEAERSHADVFRLSADHAYAIPGTPHRRRLLVYERLEGEAPSLGLGPGRAKPSRPLPSAARFEKSRAPPTPRSSAVAISSAARASASTGRRSWPAHGSLPRSWRGIPEHVLGWLTDLEGPPPPSESIPWIRLSDALFKQLDVVGTHAPLLLVSVPEIARWSDEDPWPEGCTLFVPFQDPENVGAVIRSAAAFGVARVVLLREAAHPFHPRSSRAAGPALFQVPLCQGPSLAELRVKNVPLIALDTTGPELSEAPFPDTLRPGRRRGGARASAPIAPGRAHGGSRCSRASSASTRPPPPRSPSTSGLAAAERSFDSDTVPLGPRREFVES